MTVEQEAKQLINSFYQPLGYLKCGVSSNEMWGYGKQCALIAVKRILHIICDEYNNDMGSRDFDKYLLETINHWEKVREIIEST